MIFISSSRFEDRASSAVKEYLTAGPVRPSFAYAQVEDDFDRAAKRLEGKKK